MRVLIVEDEPMLADGIARGLRNEGMAVDVAGDGHDGLGKAGIHDYDVIVLDRDLPFVHGDEVCQQLVQRGHLARILMLTASGTLEDRVTGLSLGADDYLSKPFALRELVARIRALGRRVSRPRPPVLSRGDLSLDGASREVRRGEQEIDLGRKEFGVLEVLLEADGRVVSAEELLERVWDENVDPFSNVVRVIIMTLRRKLGEPQLIETIKGVGYRIP
ncbi:MAG TPA: response regulator transcription factor [Solirubrobacteraceae bacterium]|jgi:DNA-binding response OmpR family regulator|nr:response regulator transcription factor [Solirubrobacteraceae bacterium]